MKTVIVLSDGREISSSSINETAVTNSSITQSVNDGQELTIGSVCASMAEITIITKSGDTPISAGDEITIYRERTGRNREKVGVYLCEKPTRSGYRYLNITAYDRIVKLDTDIAEWLNTLNAWPYTLFDLAKLTCEQCGLVLKNPSIPNGDYQVRKFAASSITGRTLIRWVGQIACMFCRANAEGEIEFDWYKPAKLSITPDGKAVSTVPYFMGGLSSEDYAVEKIEKVQIQHTEDDVGTIYPGTPGLKNTYRVTGNHLLTAIAPTELLPIAQSIYERLKNITYVPCSVSFRHTEDIPAGSVVNITDFEGKTFSAYVMEKKATGEKDSFKCTGSRNRYTTTAVNDQSYKALAGKVFNLKTDVDGLRAEVADVTGKFDGNLSDIKTQLSAVNVKADGISTSVKTLQQATEQQLDGTNKQIESLAKSVESKMSDEQVRIEIKKELENGVDKVTTSTGVTVDSNGVSVDKSGSDIKSQLGHAGLIITEAVSTVLSATNTGVDAKNLHATTYLIVGKNCRFEDYGSGTACFYIGE